MTDQQARVHAYYANAMRYEVRTRKGSVMSRHATVEQAADAAYVAAGRTSYAEVYDTKQKARLGWYDQNGDGHEG